MPDSFSFEYPYLVLIFAIVALWSLFVRQEHHSFYMPNFVTNNHNNTLRQTLLTFLKWSTLLAALMALSSPIITHKELIKAPSIDIVLNLDCSGSMAMTGLNEKHPKQRRWDVVKSVVQAFIKKRTQDRIGLVIFGDSSSVAAPLSRQSQTPLQIIDQISIGILGNSTALIDSLATSALLLKKSPSQSKVIILLSDGEDSASKIPLAVALKFIRDAKIRVYTVAIGESDNDLLEQIALQSRGEAFQANDKADLYQVYQTINRLEQHNEVRSRRIHITYLYAYALIPALIFGLLLAFLQRKSRMLS